MKGATAINYIADFSYTISIHAPMKGATWIYKNNGYKL